jgi:hypothetical protein
MTPYCEADRAGVTLVERFALSIGVVKVYVLV